MSEILFDLLINEKTSKMLQLVQGRIQRIRTYEPKGKLT